ncbi:MAG: RagB/SusD family nutrient uptake outer membrane protein [Dysgonamonadaceae bacterium]|jgi:hypothetical protein|nr:RagB/SusD family nutrient uptake outer membrane protein [Dysgonamonadaceae bacterium]
MKTIIKYFQIAIMSVSMGMIYGCADYLDIVPDRVATMENAFSNRSNAEKFLFTCFSYLPNPADAYASPAMVGHDEIGWNMQKTTFATRNATYLARGGQNTNDPYLNYWDGKMDGKNLFIGIRDCNIFLENVHLIPDIDEYERTRWTGEVKFLKAYYHFFLLQLYGPIPVIRENLPVNATPEEMRIYREPIDDAINYIVELLDEATPCLPLETFSTVVTEAGRITQPIALALKAKVLVWAASPLLNGDERNSPEFSLTDNRGIQLFPQTYSAEKWQKALLAIKNAIDTCHLAGHVMYRYDPTVSIGNISDATKLKYTLRGIVTSRLNPEIVWPAMHDVYNIQYWCCIAYPNYSNLTDHQTLGTTLQIAEQFYTNNGIPINEDPAWDYANRYETQIVTGDAATDHQYYLRANQASQATAKLHLYREPRFYAFVGFDRGIYEMYANSEANSTVVTEKAAETFGYLTGDRYVNSCYLIKKLVSPDLPVSGTYTSKRYSFPLIRLSDLYLLYAEVLNEINGPVPEVYQWIDTVRRRAGLNDVVPSWAQSSNPGKPSSKEGLRDIIRQERMIELAFEGQRFYDIRRWKLADRYWNGPIVRGWNYQGNTVETFYTLQTYVSREFKPRDYFWPIKLSDLITNSNLVQNPGWK